AKSAMNEMNAQKAAGTHGSIERFIDISWLKEALAGVVRASFGQQLVFREMRFGDDDRSDDASGKRLMVSFQLGKQLLHGAAGAGVAAKEKNLFGAVQRFCHRV